MHTIFPYEDHQRYGDIKFKERGQNHHFKINGRGAIGDIFKGQNIQIAFFGTSSLFHRVPINKTWPELLKKSSNSKIHVDNFGFFLETLENVKKKLQGLCYLKKFYDVLIIQLSYISDKSDSSYQDRFLPSKNSFLQSYQQIKKWYNRQTTPQFFTLFNPPSYYLHNPHDDLNDIVDQQQLRPKLYDFFVDHKIDILPEKTDKISHLIPKIINKAYCISDKVFWFSEPFAWSDNMLKSYEDIYYSVQKVSETSYVFANNKSLGNYMMVNKEIVKNLVEKQKGVVFFDLFSIFQIEITQKPNLFFDDTHLSEKGHELALQFILPFFIEHIPEFEELMTDPL